MLGANAATRWLTPRMPQREIRSPTLRTDAMTDADDRRETHGKAIARGALVNLLGSLGKTLFLVFFVLVNRLYGLEAVGVFYIAFTMIEICIALTTSGFNDGVLMFTSRYADDDARREDVYTVMANGLVFTMGVSFVLVGLAYTAAPALVEAHYPQSGTLESVQTLVWSLPFIAFTTLVVAATKSRLTMKWDALLIGFMRPAVQIVLAVIFYLADLGLSGLSWSYVVTQIAVAIAAVVVFGLYFSYADLVEKLARFRPFTPLLSFAIPQNLNMAFNNLITYFDVIMLGAFGLAPEMIAVYGMGAQVVRNVRQIKLVFSGSLAPVIARLHGHNAPDELSEAFTMVARWTTTLGLPAALVVALLRGDLLRILTPSYTGDTTFMLLLVAVPTMSCAFGLAGNVVVMTGHSRWNLLNSVTVAVLNAGLNLLLVPHYGITGAATATVIAAGIVTAMQLAEAHYLAGARLVGSLIYKPYVAILPALAVAAASQNFGFDSGLLPRIVAATLTAGTFTATLLMMGIDAQDKAALALWKSRG